MLSLLWISEWPFIFRRINFLFNLFFSGHDKSSNKEWFVYPAMVALCLSLIDFIYLFMKFKETLAPEKRLKSLQAALNQAITYVNPISLFNFQSLDNLKEEELASIKTIGKNLSRK